ncbi:MAG TPA: sigma-70 family RNA polymerase sigma factor [Paenibacillus sp.]|uniref:RNA polymerase sigma factor n=1 Tax=Paenibacillus sp. TaxID=58172 RepID=UPI002CF3A544|nr:sigma-70 family RNA polymerase sigma factor [Paenibacillus sp.]HUC92887.1 sigma-70 family RNA polymerase sigma factor [Paenibacillus sp.]
MESLTDFEVQVMPHMGELRRYCYRLTSSDWDAEDLCQEVLLRLYQYHRKIGAFEQPRPLLYKVARNIWIDAGRRKRVAIVPIEEASQLAQPESHYASTRALVEWVVGNLSDREMKMLFLAAVYRYSYQDIADELKCTIPAVKMVLLRSKAALRAAAHSSRDEMRRSASSNSRINREVDYWTHALLNNEPAGLEMSV